MGKLVTILMRALGRIFSPANVRRGLAGGTATSAHAPAPEAAEGYEHSDMRVIAVMIGGIGLLVTIAIISGLIWGMFNFLILHPGHAALPSPLANERTPSSAPRLEVVPRTTLDQTLSRTNEQLSSYGWVDQPHGVVHIPITRALDLLAERGLPLMATPPISATTSTVGATK